MVIECRLPTTNLGWEWIVKFNSSVPEPSVLYCNSVISSLCTFISTWDLEILTKLETDMEWTYTTARLDSDILRCRPMQIFETLRPRQHRRHFDNDICKWFILNENVGILIKIPIKIVPNGPINNISALVQIIAWRRPGDKSLSYQMMVI